MIKNFSQKYTVSNRWILRNDPNYHTPYTLFNVDRRIIINISAALFYIIKMLYYNALSMNEITSYLNSKSITFNPENLIKIEKEHNAYDLFIESTKPYHSIESQNSTELTNTLVPVTATPMDVEMHFTHNCNLKCKHCFQESDSHSDKKALLQPEKWIEIFKQFENLNMYTIIISGGEPLYYKGFEKVMREVINYRLNYIIFTNGMLITPSNINIFKHDNIQLTISLDGHNAEFHEILRGKNTFDKLNDKLDLLIKNNVNINIAHTLNKKNYLFLEELINYLIKKGIKNLSIGIIEPTGRAAINRELLLNKEEEKDAYNLIKAMDQKYAGKISLNFPNLSFIENASDYGNDNYVFCSAGTKRIAISSDGILYPCIYAFNFKNLAIGNLKKDTIYDLWIKDDLWQKYRGGITISQIKTCCTCQHRNACALRNCRLNNYTPENGLYAKPKNCLIDKLIL
ncbi:radical SAM/SPASM domain-containing protein [Phocaeicola massiliensis]|uniref:radical SAM/SPASM domain-containing protein n=1 Tax=Phocaeicola massiliensis TaxID=204516 RepID=UPI00202E9017|nr:radical SAM protein [Phocaeicola massiliensis]MCM1614951.1 radical SAM protein [Phocaeicola massiliensis]MCM1704790.1 radical SAM protein [Phocaeicola massiliensis]